MMKVSVKQLIAGSALALSAVAALASPVTPPSSYTYNDVGGGTNNGGLFVAAWDAVRGVSIVEYLGVNMDSFLPTTAEASGYSLEFGTLGSYSAVFGASQQSNIRYAVFAVDSAGVGNGNKRVMSTTSNTAFNITNTGTSGTASNIDTFISGALTGAGANNGANPAVAQSPSESDYAGNIQWSSLTATPFSATVGTALNFFLASSSASGNPPNGAASVNFYDNLGGFSKWLLSSTGVLTYAAAPVPLPAAVWLLFSGLAGLGVVARRRAA